MNRLICTVLDQYSLCCLIFPCLPVDKHCVGSIQFVLFDISMCTGWYALCWISTVCAVWQFNMYRLIFTLLIQYWLFCLRIAYVSVVMHCVRSVMFVLFDSSIYSGWHAFCWINIVCVVWQFHLYQVICTALDQYSLCCLTVPYVSVDMHCIRTVMLCTLWHFHKYRSICTVISVQFYAV